MKRLDQPRRVLLADSTDEVRSALRLLLEHEWGSVVISEAADSTELLDLLVGDRMDAQDELVVLLDWELSGMPAAQLLSRVRELRPRAFIAALSSRAESEGAARAAGVDAFVSKSDPPERVLAALSRGRRNGRRNETNTTEGGGDAHLA